MGEKIITDIYAVAAQFFAASAIKDIREYGTGRVNDTFLVTVAGGKVEHRFILQRISSAVFAHPEWIMENLRVVCDHVLQKLACEGNPDNWQMPVLQPTLAGSDYYRDSNGSCWRVLGYIAGCRSFATVQSPLQAREAGLALGRFHRLISDLDPAKLHDTLPGFHVTPLYLAQYDRVAASADRQGSTDIRFCHDFIARRRALTQVLEDAGKEGRLIRRPIHGDPKLSNILFDEQSGRAVSLIDLDTVKPGYIQYDVGDCLRSCCNLKGEEGPLPVSFDTELCREILQGYQAEAGSFLTTHDYGYFYDAARLIAFELGLRFFTDYLQGNVYFKASSPELNLQRAMVQFSLTESIEKRQGEVDLIIRDLV